MQAKTGIDGPNFSKWKSGNVPGVETVARFARAYNRPVLEAFVAAEFLTAEEAKQRPSAPVSADSLSDDQLVDEIRNRLRKARESDDPVTTKKGGRKAGDVHDTREAAAAAGREAVHRQQGPGEGEEEVPRPGRARGDSHAG